MFYYNKLKLQKQECGIKSLVFHKDYMVAATKLNSLFYAKRNLNDFNFPLNGVIFQTDAITEVFL